MIRIQRYYSRLKSKKCEIPDKMCIGFVSRQFVLITLGKNQSEFDLKKNVRLSERKRYLYYLERLLLILNRKGILISGLVTRIYGNIPALLCCGRNYLPIMGLF